jgi:RNA polymerase sigma-70 factor, ECF subfamily
VGEGMNSRRDTDELTAFFTAEAAGLFRYARVLTRGDHALAEDLVQAGFEAATPAWGRLRCLAEEQRRGWLRATVANIAVSGFRREAALRDRLPRIEAKYRTPQADTEAQALSSVVLERCWKIIQDMPARQHAVAVMRWLLGMKQTEIAATLGMAEKTVSVHLHRARLQLIAQLGPDCPFASDHGEGPSS